MKDIRIPWVRREPIANNVGNAGVQYDCGIWRGVDQKVFAPKYEDYTKIILRGKTKLDSFEEWSVCAVSLYEDSVQMYLKYALTKQICIGKSSS